MIPPFSAATLLVQAQPREQGLLDVRSAIRVYVVGSGVGRAAHCVVLNSCWFWLVVCVRRYSTTRASTTAPPTEEAIATLVDGVTIGPCIQNIALNVISSVRAPDTSGVPQDGHCVQFDDVPIGCIKWTSFVLKNHGMAPDRVVCTIAHTDVTGAAGTVGDRPSFIAVPSSFVVEPMQEATLRIGFFPHAAGAVKVPVHAGRWALCWVSHVEGPGAFSAHLHV